MFIKHLNTSHVTVNRKNHKVMMFQLENLNTSHVTVNLCRPFSQLLTLLYLNTSHVTVNPTDHAALSSSTTI